MGSHIDKNLVAVVIPIYKDFGKNSPYEIISLKRGVEVFKNRDIYFVGPKRLNTEGYKEYMLTSGSEFNFFSFDDVFFSSIWGYNQLCLLSNFYKKFLSYQFMLLYQTDAFAFRDDLNEWCSKDFDYIGAPWLVWNDEPTKPSEFFGVGNGGASLRKTSSFYKISNSFFIKTSRYMIARLIWFPFFRSILKKNRLKSIFSWIYHYRSQEDFFWGVVAKQWFPDFKVPAPEEALQFSFEVEPAYLYERNGHKLPTVCHAWEKHDLNFWKPFIEELGYHI